jgi:hypothetical protein
MIFLASYKLYTPPFQNSLTFRQEFGDPSGSS